MITDYTKQMELINAHEVSEPINVIGCGALGSWIAFFLLKMGFRNVHVYDYDTIEEHNIPNQLFKENQIGMKKTQAMHVLYKEFFNDCDNRITVHEEKITEDNAFALRGIIFCAVDTMEGRKTIYETAFKYSPNATLWIEGRLSIWGAYIYSIDRMTNLEQYEKTFYKDTEAEVSACGTSQTALPSAVNCASTMLMQMITYLNNKETGIEDNALEYSIPWLVTIRKRWK